MSSSNHPATEQPIHRCFQRNEQLPTSGRRQLLLGSASLLVATAGVAGSSIATAQTDDAAQTSESDAVELRGRIRQSVMGWCFDSMTAVELAKLGKRLGLVAIEGIDRGAYAEVKQLGLDISIVGSHGFATGPISTDDHDEVEMKLRSAIDVAIEVGSPNVITFTGMRQSGIRDEAAKRNCLDCWKRVIDYAEQNRVTLCLEHLNSRDDSHPMKGHPGYFGDDVELCIELVHKMDSKQFKLLFDVYHVQVMHGDVIRRIREFYPWVGHYHTAGNPGRGELDDSQEINYPPIMHAILETGYEGYVAQEFIPTWNDPAAALQHAIHVCDV